MTRRAYTVVWDEDLLDDLAAFWQAAEPDVRKELTRACNTIDRMLAAAPMSVGRPWENEPDQYLWSMPGYRQSIGVVYTVHELDRITRVVRLYTY